MKQKKQLQLTHLEKIFWPKEKYTKGDVIAYYDKISPYILPHLHDRPMVMNRHPNGIKGKNFYHKDSSDLHLPPFVKSAMIYSESNEKKLRYILCNNKETLLYLANLGCIEMNPWASTVHHLEKPDFFIADLDPQDIDFSHVIEAAQEVYDILEKLRVKSFCKTSGKRGLHIYVPLHKKYTYEISREFGKLLGGILQRRLPKIMSQEYQPQKRRGKIHLDYMRNAKGQTAASVYSLRPYKEASISTPLHWSEVKKGLDPQKYTIKTIWKRLEKENDIWKGVLGKGVDLEKALSRIEKLK